MKSIIDKILEFNQIVIQCHDNPDPDALASGFGLYKFLKSKEKSVRLVYGGRFEITKSNLMLMKNLLEIPIEYISDELKDTPQLLICVDCQYGESNVTMFQGTNIAVIDHHIVKTNLPKLSDVREGIGSCSSIIWELLMSNGYDVNKDSKLATALYYGLYTDTNGFADIRSSVDKRLRDKAKYDRSIFRNFRASNLSLEELAIVGEAVANYTYDEKYRFAIVEAKPCDPNILGIISDLLFEVDIVDISLVFSVLDMGVKISVRSCNEENDAASLAEYIARDRGGGGGHIDKAGGFIESSQIPKGDLRAFFAEQLRNYLDM